MTLTIQDQNQAIAFTADDINLLKRTYCNGATEADFKLFTLVCERTRLSPFAKQIYAVFRNDSKTKTKVMTIQTSIDGFRLVAERTQKYSPGRATTFEYDENKKLVSATAYVKKMTPDGTWHEVSHTAYYDEFCQKTKNYQTGEMEPSQFWAKMPKVMLSKVAEASCLRRCFPMELSQLYVREEMMQAECEDVTPPKEENEQPKEPIEPAKEVEQSKPDRLAKELVSELEMAMKQCTPQWNSNAREFMMTQWKASTVAELPAQAYKPMMNSIQKNLELQAKGG